MAFAWNLERKSISVEFLASYSNVCHNSDLDLFSTFGTPYSDMTVRNSSSGRSFTSWHPHSQPSQ